MKKFLRFIIFIIILFIGYKLYMYYNGAEILLKETEEERVIISDYSIMGTHLNIKGCIEKTLSEDASLVLKNKQEEI